MDRWESFPAEDVERAFELFTRSASTMAAPVALLVARGDLELFTGVQSHEELPPGDELVERHNSMEHMSSREGKRHLRHKIHSARYFESVGFDVSKKTTEPLEYDCFEIPINGHTSDVFAESDDGYVVGEVGYVEPKYLLKAFGYSILETYYTIEDLKEHLARTSDSSVSHFVTAPYKEQSSRERRYFIFKPTEKMPEPDMGQLANKVGEILDDG